MRNRRSYYYKLEEIDIQVNNTIHGPVSAVPRRVDELIVKEWGIKDLPARRAFGLMAENMKHKRLIQIVLLTFFLAPVSIFSAEWTLMEISGAGNIYDIWGSSGKDVYAVDDNEHGNILHYDGTNWSLSSQPCITSFTYPSSCSYEALFGTSGKDIFLGYHLYICYPAGPSEAWSDGIAIGRLHGDVMWEWWVGGGYGCQFFAHQVIYDIWGSSATDVFALAEIEMPTPPASGPIPIILHCDGTNCGGGGGFSPEYPLYAIWGSSGSDVFAVGDMGNILHYDGDIWAPSVSGTTIQLNGIWGSLGTDVFAVGENGTILHYDGKNWCNMNSGTIDILHDIWGSSGTNVFAVGNAGTILHYDGTSWSPMSSPTGNDLFAIWGSSECDVFVVGAAGTILHYGDLYSISGNVSGDLIDGVTMTLSGDISATTTTNSSGDYDFSRLCKGTYTVTPSKPNYTFSPPSISVTIDGADMTDVNFTATKITYSISGSISGDIIEDVTMTLSSDVFSTTTVTDSSGNYLFSDLSNGTYTVTPSKPCYTFSPPEQTLTISDADVTGVDFTATAVTYSICGTVTGDVQEGVTITLSGPAPGTAVTNESGSYCFTGLINGTYTVTPIKSGYAFIPSSQEATISCADVTGINFVATELLPDLTGAWSNITKIFYRWMYYYTATLSVSNTGVPATNVRVNVYFSKDKTYNPGDKFISSITFDSINAGETKKVPIRNRLRFDLAGKYYIGVIDPFNSIEESNEDNNIVVSNPIP